ncbi:DMT family transporter [Mesobacillus foraminis]|uniref:DMT family transporter n=1 Tax=Mesobacillus foraminis TaxID=279826 RepID=UPI0039A25DE8
MKPTWFADVSLLLVALIWGATFVLVQNAISFLEPLSFNAVRFTLAAILLGFWLLLFERQQLKMFSIKLLTSGIMIGICLFIGYAFQTLGLVYTTSSKAGFITGLSVVLVPLFTVLIFKHKLGVNSYLGAAAATAGLYLLTLTDIASLNMGDGFILICAVGFAFHILMTGKYSSHYPSLLLTVVQIATVALLSGALAWLFEDWKQAFNPAVLLSPEVAAALLVTAVFATALAFLIQTNFQKYTSATRVALIFAMEPVFAAITGYFWAGDRLSYSAALGCLFIFLGMVAAELPSSVQDRWKKKFNLHVKKGADSEV